MIELYAEADQPGLPPLLLLHGFLSSRNHWRPNALSGHFRCIRVELPGHGFSPAPASPREYTPDALEQAVDAVRLRLGIERWFICGQSFGAGITLRHALARPEAVIAQAFTNSNGALRAEWTGELLAAHEARIEDVYRHGKDALRRFAFHPAHARRFPADIRDILAADADACDVGAILNLMREATTRLSVSGRLDELRVPTLLINGTRERGFQAARDRLAARFSGIDIVDLDGGHSINIEQPEAFDAALIRFFAQATEAEAREDAAIRLA